MERQGIKLRIDVDSLVEEFVGDKSIRAKRVRLLASETKRLQRALDFLTRDKEVCQNDKMPWTPKTFRRHNKSLTDKEAKKASEIANAVLKDTGNEGLAVRTANSKIKHSLSRKISRMYPKKFQAQVLVDFLRKKG